MAENCDTCTVLVQVSQAGTLHGSTGTSPGLRKPVLNQRSDALCGTGTGLEMTSGPAQGRFDPSQTTRKSGDKMLYPAPGAAGAKIAYKTRYDNFIGGKFVAPVEGAYFDVITPITGKPYTQAARS